MLHNFLHLTLATKVFYIFVVIAALVNMVSAFMPRIKWHWRFHFSYAATLLVLYATYISLRLANVLDPKDYTVLVQWLFPLLIFPMIIPALLIRWESKYFKQALEKQADDQFSHNR